MKFRKLILSLSIALLPLFSYAQYSIAVLPNRGSNPGIPGGPDGKTFAAIIETGGNKASLVQNTLEFLKKYEIVEKDYDIDSKIEEVSEDMSMFTIPVQLKVGYHLGGLKMARVSENAIRATANMRFEFYENGNMMIVFEHFGEETFVHRFEASKTLYKEYEKNRNSNLDIGKDLMMEWNGQFTGPLYETAISKIVVFANVGTEGIKNFYDQTDKFFNDLNKRFRYLDEIANKSKYFDWMTDSEAIDYMSELVANGDTFGVINNGGSRTRITKEFEAGRLLSLNKKAFESSVMPIITRTFASMYYIYGGKITGIAEDGNQTWELVGDRLLPVDTKLRKTLEKNGQDFFTYAYEQ